ncbi:Transcription factor HES-4 like protein [Argiope bruennichi]|uniref:Transcription factor HES-4 like protein n=1 Tax=Argiope bruennichi TaxID=94029 RepID=A0A8T0ECL4_ARGBR|nr:Transcription factor HES-4 like protein [Argiope bruennichi]
MPTKRSQEFMDLKNGNDKKASKPLIEKRRRARINHSLAQLKTLVIDSKTENTRQTKLEKADILEMTVQHLKDTKKQQNAVTALDIRQGKKKFEIGYMECARQVELFLANLMDPNLIEVEENLKRRLKDHLCRSLQDFPCTDENIHVDKYKGTLSQNLANSVSPLVPTVIKDNHSNILQKRCDDIVFSEDVAQSNAVVENPYSINISYDQYETDQMNINEVRNSHFENSHFSGGSKTMCHQNTLQPEILKPHQSPFPEQETFSKARFNPSPNGLDRYQPSPSSSDSNSTSYAQEWLNLKIKCPNDISNPKTSQFCSTSFQQNTNVQRELHQSTSTVKTEDNYHQISLVPRRLSNGEWALVLPGNFTLTEKEHSPLSAFKLVWPTNSTEVDNEQQGMGQRGGSGSPLSSSVSDLSSEDYGYRMDVEPPVKIDHDGQTDFGYVWRPW